MKKAFTLAEITIAIAIIVLSIVFLTSLGMSYLSILNSIRTRYVGLNIAQSQIELAIALRNQQIEKGLSPWVGVSAPGNYCIYFDQNTSRIIAEPGECTTSVEGFRRLISYSDFENPGNSNLTTSRAVRVRSEVYLGRDQFKLDVVLTKWHPTQ
jgi:type II secretory pathway pseudopilin PulG